MKKEMKKMKNMRCCKSCRKRGREARRAESGARMTAGADLHGLVNTRRGGDGDN